MEKLVEFSELKTNEYFILNHPTGPIKAQKIANRLAMTNIGSRLNYVLEVDIHTKVKKINE